MKIYEEAVALLARVKDETAELETGVIPGVNVLLGLQRDVIDMYGRLGEEQSRQFGAKEVAILDRKVTAAKYHLKGRMEFSMTQEDARVDAIQKSKEEYEKEIQAMSLYEHNRILRDSLDRAFSYLVQVSSWVKNMENRVQ